jgi:ATP-dependent DNA helicase PIF1
VDVPPKLLPRDVEINAQFRRALDIMELPRRHVFITGKAGTGKSTLLSYFRTTTRKNVVILAPTGVAALNVQGETIHSFFRFKPDITPEKIKKPSKATQAFFRKVDAIIIDEISMVRADLLDCVDVAMRLNTGKKNEPFGGIKLIFIGDLYQLPPVVTGEEENLFKGVYESPYFFSARVFGELDLELIELDKIYRQSDDRFIRILNAIRHNRLDPETFAALNSRVGAKFPDTNGGLEVCLVPTNRQAQELNGARLRALAKEAPQFTAEIEGKIERGSYPADEALSLAPGAQVMFLNNDSGARWVNGTMGQVIDISFAGIDPVIFVRLENGGTVEVGRHSWDVFHYRWNEEAQAVDTETIGAFRQYPLRLAWAVTIHKSQGKTFDRVMIDMGRGAFAHGQTYVALSRARALEGIVLKKPIYRSDLLTDTRVAVFMDAMQKRLGLYDAVLNGSPLAKTV